MQRFVSLIISYISPISPSSRVRASLVGMLPIFLFSLWSCLEKVAHPNKGVLKTGCADNIDNYKPIIIIGTMMRSMSPAPHQPHLPPPKWWERKP